MTRFFTTSFYEMLPEIKCTCNHEIVDHDVTQAEEYKDENGPWRGKEGRRRVRGGLC